MRLLADARFIAGLYRYLDKRQRRFVNCFVALVAAPLVVFMVTLVLGLPSSSDSSVAADAHKPAVRSEPPLPYVPQPPTTAWPAEGAITAGFGVRTPAQRHHSGIDIGGRHGDPVRPFRAGRVIIAEHRSSNSTGLGKYVAVDHGNNTVSYYGHLSSVHAVVGQSVTTRAVIGKVGSTGVAYGTHLHFEIRVNDKVVDPRRYVSGLPAR